MNKTITIFLSLALLFLGVASTPAGSSFGGVVAHPPVLNPPPRMPERPAPAAGPYASRTIDCSASLTCAFLPLVINRVQVYPILNRQQSADLFNSVYMAPPDPTGWNGDINNCVPGTTTQAFKNSVLARVNYFRQVAGIPPVQDFNEQYNLQDQSAALMMSANLDLNHTPPNSWKCWTQTGYLGASTSNLAEGANGPTAIDLYMDDGGVPSLGHRRWVLFPQTQEMGSGDIDGNGTDWRTITNALKVFDSHSNDPLPNTRDPFVAWPPATFVPYQVVFPIWSFAVADADFTNAEVTVTSTGAPIKMKVNILESGFGENTISWDACNGCANWPNPGDDQAYSITVSKVLVNGSLQDFTYSVTVIDPAR